MMDIRTQQLVVVTIFFWFILVEYLALAQFLSRARIVLAKLNNQPTQHLISHSKKSPITFSSCFHKPTLNSNGRETNGIISTSINEASRENQNNEKNFIENLSKKPIVRNFGSTQKYLFKASEICNESNGCFRVAEGRANQSQIDFSRLSVDKFNETSKMEQIHNTTQKTHISLTADTKSSCNDDGDQHHMTNNFGCDGNYNSIKKEMENHEKNKKTKSHHGKAYDIILTEENSTGILQSEFDVNEKNIWSLLSIPNVTERKQLFNQMITTAISNHQTVRWSLPIQQLLKAILNGTELPTFVPQQTQQFPSLERDIYCNPSLMSGGCSSFSEWGRAIGIPMRSVLINSQLGSLNQRIGGTANLLYEKLSRGLTATFIDFLEMEGHVQQIEQFFKTLSPLFTYDRNRDKLPQLVSNLSSFLIFDNGLIVDRDTVLNTFNNVMKDKVKAAALCRLSNGHLPNCGLTPTQSTKIEIYEWPKDGPKNNLGFYEFIVVQGFNDGCTIYRGCISGNYEVNGTLFDGLYFFANVDQYTGYPIYWKPILSKDFPNVHSLILWQGSFIGPNTELLAKEGIFAAITPNQPNFDYAMFGTKIPFAFRFGVDGPSQCHNKADFPHCMMHDNHWVLSRYSSAYCSGGLYNSRECQWRIPNIHFFGSDIPNGIAYDDAKSLRNSTGNK